MALGRGRVGVGAPLSLFDLFASARVAKVEKVFGGDGRLRCGIVKAFT